MVESIDATLKAMSPVECREALALPTIFYQARNWPRFYAWMNRGDFLSAKVRLCRGYQAVAEDVWARALPACRQRQDAGRFLRFAAFAHSLGALTRSLADEEILYGLAQNGQVAEALDVLEQVPESDLCRRAVLRAAVIAGSQGSSSAVSHSQYVRLREELDLARPLASEAQARQAATSVCRIVHYLGDVGWEYAQPLIRRLGPHQAAAALLNTAGPRGCQVKAQEVSGDRFPSPPQASRQGAPEPSLTLSDLWANRFRVETVSLIGLLERVADRRPDLVSLLLARLTLTVEDPANLLTEIAQGSRQREVIEGVLTVVERGWLRRRLGTRRGFEVRYDWAKAVACRLARTAGDLGFLETAGRFLLDEEQDQVAAAAALVLADHERPALAWKACARIRSRPLHLLTALRLHRKAPGNRGGVPLEQLLRFEHLYRVFQETQVFRDELLAHAALCQHPLDPVRIIEAQVVSIRSAARQTSALIDLAWHVLAYQQSAPRRPDAAPVRNLVSQALERQPADGLLLELLPDVFELQARVEPRTLAVEFVAACEAILSLDRADSVHTARALAALTGRLQALLAPGGGLPETARLARQCEVVEAVLRLLQSPGNPALGAALRERGRGLWHRVLPTLLGLLRRLPVTVWSGMSPACLARSAVGLLGEPAICALVARLAGRQPRAVRDALFRRLGGLEVWQEFPESHRVALATCFAEAPVRQAQIQKGLRTARLDPLLTEVLAVQCLAEDESLALDLLDTLPKGPDRSELCGFVALSQPLSLAGLARLEALAGRTTGGALATAYRCLQSSTVREMVDCLADLVSVHEVPPESHVVRRLLRRLWELDAPEAKDQYARRIVPSLGAAAPAVTASSLRLWIALSNRPCLGRAAPQAAEALAVLSRRLARASRITRAESGEVEGETPSSEPPERLRRIHRLWTAEWPEDHTWWGEHARESCRTLIPLVVLATSLTLLPFDGHFLDPSTLAPPVRGALTAVEKIGVGLSVLLGGFGAWMVSLDVKRRTPPETHFRGWLTALRCLISALPVFGLLTLPAWQWMLEAKPSWAVTPTCAPPRNRPLPDWRAALVLRLELLACRLWPFYVLGGFVAGFAVLLFLGWTFVWREPAAPWQGALIRAAGLLLHAGVTVGFGYFFLNQAREEHRVGWSRFREFILLPFFLLPYPGLALVGMIIWALLANRRSPVVATALRRRKSIRRVPAWRALERSLERGRSQLGWARRLAWPRQAGASLEATRGEAAVRILYGVKSCALIGESAGLVWALCWVGHHCPYLGPIIGSLIWLLVTLPLALSLVGGLWLLLGLLHRVAGFANRFLDRSQQEPYALFLMATHLAVLCGTLLGVGYWEQRLSLLGGLMLLTGLAIAVGQLLSEVIRDFLPIVAGRGHYSLAWAIGGVLLGLAGLNVVMHSDAPEAIFTIQVLQGLLWLLPWASVLGYALLPDLLSPATLDDRCDPKTPAALRRLLTFLSVTAVLPFGGLAIPVWMALRQRYWPRLFDLKRAARRL